MCSLGHHSIKSHSLFPFRPISGKGTSILEVCLEDQRIRSPFFEPSLVLIQELLFWDLN